MNESAGGGLILVALLAPALRQSTPLVLAAMGGVLSERVGVVNIALEGMMLTGAFTGLCAAQALGPASGFAVAVLAGMALGLTHYLFTQRLQMNHIVSGVALNILAAGATTYLLRRLFNQAIPPRSASITTPLPVGLFIVLAAIVPFLLHFVLYRTAFGLRLRAVGENPESARLSGITPGTQQLAAVVASGACAAAAGAYLSLALVGRFSDDMVSGRGYIALAAVICGRWTPLGAALAALAFGLFDALQIRLQGTVAVPTDLLRCVPYVCTLVAALWLRPVPPAALGHPAGE